MKQGNLVVSLILIVAILLGAYGLGLLIRQARMGDRQPPTQPVAEVNDPAALQRLKSEPRIGRAKPEPTPEELAAAKQQRAEKLSEAENLTDQQRQERRDALRAQLRSQTQRPGQLPHLSPEELKDIREKWPQMSEEERQAYRAQMRGTRSAPARRAVAPRDVNDGKAQAAEPNEPGSN